MCLVCESDPSIPKRPKTENQHHPMKGEKAVRPCWLDHMHLTAGMN